MQIGKPQQTQQSNSFADIKMKQMKALTNEEDRDLDDVLNQVSGRKRKSKYVDAKEHNKLGKDGFLKLLTHQLQNQDPFKPMDQKEFAADLAQFSQLEQLTKMNKNMETQSGQIPTESKFYGASFLGKEILTNGTTINYDGSGKDVQIPFQLDKDAKHLFVRIYDSRNQLVAQLEKEDVSKGSQSMTWSGTTRDNTITAKDTYRFEVIAYDNQMEEFFGKTSSAGVVTGVEFDEQGEAVLTVDNEKKVFLRDVQSFRMPKAVSGQTQMTKNVQQAQKEFQKNMPQY